MPKAEGETAQKTKNGAVELLRILAITCILFHHYQQLTGVYYPEGLNFYNGRFPFQYLVELFFLLSGFLAARYIPQIVAELRFGPFIVGRIRRLFPGMVLSVFVCYVLMYIYYRQYGNYWMDIPINKGRLLVTMLGMGSGWFVSGTQINGPGFRSGAAICSWCCWGLLCGSSFPKQKIRQPGSRFLTSMHAADTMPFSGDCLLLRSPKKRMCFGSL